MFRFLMRAIGSLLLAGALAALVVDGTRSIASSRLVVTGLQQSLAWAGPTTLALVQARMSSGLGTPVLAVLGLLPTSVALGVLGLLLLRLGRPPRPMIGIPAR